MITPEKRDNSTDRSEQCHFCPARATREIEGLPVCYAHVGTALGAEPKALPEGHKVEISPTFERSANEHGFRTEAAMAVATGQALHLWRAYFWARQLGADLQALPWFLEYLDRVADRLHRIEPGSDKEVAELVELTLTDRRPRYDHRRDDLARAVVRWRKKHPTLRAQAFAAVAKQTGATEAEVRHAYYFFPENMRKS